MGIFGVFIKIHSFKFGINKFGFDFEEIILYLCKEFINTLISFSGGYKMFDSFVLFGDIFIKNFSLKVTFTSDYI